MDVLTKEQRTKNMKAIKSKNTLIERMIAGELWKRGYRYRRNTKKIFGKPDFVFIRLKVAIFCDSDFFHGKDWEVNNERIKSNRDFWIPKIEGNMIRDQLVTSTLITEGWTVIRLWESDIKRDLNRCIEMIINKIDERKQ